MKKKLLFIAPDFYGFHEVIMDGLQKYSDCNVYLAISSSTKKFKYKSFWDRLHNFLSKTFLNKNLKDQKKKKQFLDQINQQNNYDILIVNRPDILTNEIYDYLNTICKQKIVVLWDSLEKIKGQKETLHFFDKKFSFDQKDCENFQLTKINNFYFNEQHFDNKPIYEIIFLGTYDNRFNDLIKISKYFQNQNRSFHSYIFYPPIAEIHKKIDHQFSVLSKIIPFNKSYQISNLGNIILDIAHPHQTGLSFRPFEAIGSKKKLITTNVFIKNYDFYRPNNIFIIEDVDHICIPSSFFETEYEDLPNEIINQYSIKTWIENLIQ